MTEWLRFLNIDVTRYRVTPRGKWASSFVLFAIEIMTVLALVLVGGAPWWLAIACEMALSLGGRVHGIVTVNEQLTEQRETSPIVDTSR